MTTIELSLDEKQTLKRVKRHYFNLNRRRPLLEDLVKMVVLSPLLDLSGFYSQDWEIKTEAKVEYSLDEEEIIRGYIDILIVQKQLWLLVIETKRTQISVLTAIPQILFYMLNSPSLKPTTFGLVTNGFEFVFLKLSQAGNPVFSRTYALSLEREEVQQVLRGLKYLNQNLL